MTLRDSNLDKLGRETFDVLILGGGINGAVSAAALAAKGAKVALIDKGDFAGETSSQSSNLAWGGIKYLESREFRLVNKLCKSRNHLMRSYPSTVKEIRFLTTIAKGFRLPAPLVYCGSLLYWLFGRLQTQAPVYRSARKLELTEPVINTSNADGGFEYSDCYLYDNDARFVFNFIRRSMDYGAIAANYVESLGASQNQGLWQIQAKDNISGKPLQITTKVLINACGPLVDQHNEMAEQSTNYRHLFSKGVHLIVDQITDNKRVLAFFASDGRLFFVIPMGPKTCIGTTDTQVSSADVEVTDDDREFILDNVNRLLDLPKPLTTDDIIAERCGVRPLAQEGNGGVADWVKLSRKHKVEVNTPDRHLSIFGGKLTDCINVGDEIAEHIRNLGIPLSHPHKKWYGEPGKSLRREFFHQAQLMKLDAMTDPSSPEPLSERLWRRYGAESLGILDAIREKPSRAKLLIENAEYIRAEIELAARREMIVKLEDFLRRRSKIALVVRHNDLKQAPGLKKACEILFGDQAETKLNEYMQTHS